MLLTLSIKNFSLIQDLEVSFGPGLNVLTGETGSGKSILLNALSLILGYRADLSLIRPGTSKCIVEATFDYYKNKHETLFTTLDLDIEPQINLRRELSSNGKSRAFINDTPVNLDIIKTIADSLVDIHTQRQTFQLTDQIFYLNLLDACANNEILLASYAKTYNNWIKCKNDLNEFKEQQCQSNDNLDYNSFLLQELEEIQLSSGCISSLEKEANLLRNATTLRDVLSELVRISSFDVVGVQDQLISITNLLNKISSFGDSYSLLYERILSLKIEFTDIFSEAKQLGEEVQHDPVHLQKVEDKLSTLHRLCQKHRVKNADGLIEKREYLRMKCEGVGTLDEKIILLDKMFLVLDKKLKGTAFEIRNKREAACGPLTNMLIERSRDLGMEHVRFSIEISHLSNPTFNGTEKVELFFSANKGIDFASFAKIASGGELSRIMLVVKSIMSEKTDLPTLILDEIDTGVSGEMAKSMGNRMYKMSRNLQLISISHLPQIAALADQHYKVYKKVINDSTHTFLNLLNEDQRIEELAEMLSGKEIKESAIVHARELRNV